MASIPNDSDTYDRPIELDPLPEPALPKSVAALIVAIGAIIPIPYELAFEALSALIVPVRQWPENTHKAAVRAAKDAKLAEMHAARNAAARATERQAMPVMPEPATTVPGPGGAFAPRMATFTRIKSGRYAGQWGVRIPSGRQYVRVGDIVRATGSRGASMMRVVDIVWGDTTSTIAAVEDAPSVSEASRTNTPAQGIPVAAPTTTPEVSQTPEVAPESAQEPGWTPVMIAQQATGPIVHEPTGPSIFDRPRSERTFRVGTQTESASDVRKLISERDFIAGAVAEGSMLQVSWIGGGTTTLGKVRDVLIAINREDDAPSAPSAVAHAGRAVESLRNREWDTARLPTNGLPEGIKARWLVGRKLTGQAVRAGDAYGEATLIISLKDDDTLSFDGDITLSNAVRSHYATATAKETLKSEDLTAWLGRTLKRTHGAVKRGPVWYVPGGQAEAARKLSEAIAPLWGDHERIPVTTGADLCKSLTRGLTDEVAAVAKSLAADRDMARERATVKARKDAAALHGATEESINAAVELAGRRAEVSATVASRLLRSLVSVAARVNGYEVVLGEDATRNAKAMIADLRSQLDKLSDDGSARAAMLELS
jgi:hypothetical protein